MKPAGKTSCAETLLEERVFVAIARSAASLSQVAEQLFKSHGLTPAQYNVLRILRGAEPEGLLCRGISERMIDRDPDITRLLDRMEKHALITRERQTQDRRVIMTRITSAGLALLKKLDQPVREIHKAQLAHMSVPRMKTLVELLDEIAQHDYPPRAAASK